MQIKIFTIPVIGGEKLLEEMNAFLRSRRVLQIDRQLAKDGNSAFWTFCVQFLEGPAQRSGVSRNKGKPDYKKLLDNKSFKRFSKMREIRRTLAKEEAVPAYAIFTDAELAELAKVEKGLTKAKMIAVKGVGKKKVEKYGKHFLNSKEANEKG